MRAVSTRATVADRLAAGAATRLLDIVPIPMGYLGPDLVVRMCTPAAAEALGRPREGLVGTSAREIFRRKDEMLKAFDEVIETGAPRSIFLSHGSGTGPTRHWEVSLVPDIKYSHVPHRRDPPREPPFAAGRPAQRRGHPVIPGD